MNLSENICKMTNRTMRPSQTLAGAAGVFGLVAAIFGLAAWYLEVLEEEQRREETEEIYTC